MQDYIAADFAFDKNDEPHGVLCNQGFQDPYKTLYKTHTTIPKQSLNVNPLELNKFSVLNYLDYFSYDTSYLQQEEQKDKINVCLCELFLKKKILNQESLNGSETHESFPIAETNSLWNLSYIYKNRLLYFENGIAKTIDFSSPEGKEKRKNHLEKLGIYWSKDIELNFRKKYPYVKDPSNKIERVRFILGKNLVIEIEENHNNHKEKILYNYQEIAIVKKDNPGESARAGRLIKGQRGIWFDTSDNAYSVGDVDALLSKQPRAHSFRKFSVYRNDDNFEVKALLESLAVEFVRNKQYTVYPFFFDLLKLYME